MTHTARAYIQEYFRIRKTDGQGLNAAFDAGDPAENTNTTIAKNVIFRIRFKVRETAGGTFDPEQFKLQCNRNADGWVDVGISNDLNTDTSPIICYPSSQFSDGAATSTELLTNVGTYVNGEGVAAVRVTGNVLTGIYNLANTETELEFCLKILGWQAIPASVAGEQVVASDTIELRVVESDGTVFGGTYTNPTITVAETNKYIGGTPVETPSRILYMDTDDDIFALVENNGAGAANPDRLMIKSSNDGDTWAEVDAADAPSQRDWESADMHVVSRVGYIGSQLSSNAYHDQFNFSTEQWSLTDEAVQTGVTRDDQIAAIARRSDSTIVMFWQEQSTDFRIAYKIRSSGGSWGSVNYVDTESGVNWSGVWVVLGASDRIHIFYNDNTNGNLYHRSLSSGDSLGARDLVHNDTGTGGNDLKPVIGVVYYDASGTERIVVAVKDASDGLIYTSKVDNDGTPSTVVAATDNAAKGDGVGGNDVQGQLINDGSELYIIYADSTNGEIWITNSSNYGSWDTDTKIHASIDADYLAAEIMKPSGGGVYAGYLYEDDSNAENGFLSFGYYQISAGGHAPLVAAAGTFSLAGQATGLLASRLLTAANGSFSLTGQAAGLSKVYRVLAESGTFALTGQATGLLASRLLTAEFGTINLAGQATGLLKQYGDLVAESGTFTLTGQAAGLIAARLLAAEFGTISLVGQATGLLRQYTLPAESGSFSLVGQATGLLRQYGDLVAESGTFTLTGQAAGLLKQHADLVAASGTFSLVGQNIGISKVVQLVAESGSFSLAGQATGLLASRLLTAEFGTISLVGQATGLLKQYGDLVAESGSFSLVGQAAGLIAARLLAAEFGTFTLSGQAATLTKIGGFTLVAESGSFSLAGQTTGLLASRLLAAGFGTFTLSGQNAGISKVVQLVAESGSFSLVGQATGLLASRLLTAEFGTFTLSGQAATLTKIGSFTLVAESGSFSLVGQTAGLLKQYGDLVAESGAFTLTGQAAGLIAARLLAAEFGTFTLTGQDAILSVGAIQLIIENDSIIIQAMEQDATIVKVDEQDAIIVQVDERDSTLTGGYEL